MMMRLLEIVRVSLLVDRREFGVISLAILIVGVGISAVLHDEIGRGGERYRM